MADVIPPWAIKEEGEELSWSNALLQGGQNLPRSTVGVGKDIATALMSPLDTGWMIIKLMSGGLQHLLGEDIVNFIDPEGKSAESKEIASAVGHYFQEKYGGEDNIKHAIANDPASVLMDIAVVLTGGGMAVTKAGQLSKIAQIQKAGEVAKTTATYVDPLTLALRGTGKAITGGSVLARELSGATSGTGGSAVAHVFDEARVGAKEGAYLKRGERGQQLTEAMRRGGNLDEMLQIAMRDLEVMKTQKQSAYRANEALWKNDSSILNFKAIDEALAKADKMVNFKGQIVNQKAADAVIALRKMVNEWKALDGKTFHTPEGMDKLKQKMWSVIEGIEAENKTAQAIGKIFTMRQKTLYPNRLPDMLRQ